MFRLLLRGLSANCFATVFAFSRADWSRAIDKSTDHENDVIVAQFVFISLSFK